MRNIRRDESERIGNDNSLLAQFIFRDAYESSIYREVNIVDAPKQRNTTNVITRKEWSGRESANRSSRFSIIRKFPWYSSYYRAGRCICVYATLSRDSAASNFVFRLRASRNDTRIVRKLRDVRQPCAPLSDPSLRDVAAPLRERMI